MIMTDSDKAAATLAIDASQTHTRSPSTASTIQTIMLDDNGCFPPCERCHCHTKSQLMASRNRNVLHENTSSSNISHCSCPCSEDTSARFLPMPSTTAASQNCSVSDDEECSLRYLYKGVPPEGYSAKMEFPYKRSVVEEQLLFKKTCEWWFYESKCSNMSTYWKQNAFLIFIISALALLGVIIFLCLPVKNGTEMKITTAASTQRNLVIKESHHSNSKSHTMVKTATIRSEEVIITTTTRSEYVSNGPVEVYNTDISTHYMNRTYAEIIEDEGANGWSIERENIDVVVEGINNSLARELTIDYVRPIKVDNFSLNTDDLLYESKRNLHDYNNNNNDYFSSFKATGTFRSKSSQIWDPHPEYILNVFGHRLHLILHQDISFIPIKTFRVINILSNRSEEEEEEEEPHYLGCYYKGYVDGDDESAVAVSLCHGMTGYIKTSFGSLLIQPMNQTYDAPLFTNNNNNNNNNNNKNNLTSEIVHKVWRHSGRNARHAVSILDLDLEEFEKSFKPKTLLRRKREYEDHRTIELLVAVDRTMKEFHKHDLNSYILILMSIVSNVFADASIGNFIHISVVNILVLHDNERRKRSYDETNTASHLLKDFCSHVAKGGYHYDTAMLLTRDQICSNVSAGICDTLGLAEFGTVCRRSSCSIVQDNGLSAAFTIAHELGHILNMPHDDDKRCEKFNKHGKKHIMSSMMSDDIHPWSWSNCSRHYVSETLEREDKSCLQDTSRHFIRNNNTRLPGEIYSLDDQCKLIHGNQSRYCPIETDCKRLWCKIHDNNSDCRSSSLPWADGTPCNGNGNTFWCQKGECVSRLDHTKPAVNGGWGPWSPFSHCSLTCGGGVQKSVRECNNPIPRDGGKYCSGAHKKYRSCNTHNCPPGSMDAREEQCYRHNNKNYNIKGVPPRPKWIPKYGLSNKEKCHLYCRPENDSAYYLLKEEVIDGTTCSFDTFDKCVNGICRPAGCDNELNSIAKLDKCGVCEGRNDTCEEFTGNFYVSDLYKIQPKSKTYYYYVTTIPKDASNIVIEQPGYHDENYIVLRDDQGKSLLNGDKVITPFRKVNYYAGVVYEYNGSNKPVEKVNTTYTRKLKKDLIVEIISTITTNSHKNNDTLLMTYTYTIDKSDYMDSEVEIYRWEMQQWSTCDALCHGRMYRLPVCVSTVQALKVAPQFCDPQAKPTIEYRTCNTDCILTLNVTNISECSATCGALGTREKTYHCIQTFTEIGRSNIVDLKYCSSKFEINTHEECREGCWQYREWSTCSKSCGYGEKTRNVSCFFNQSIVRDDYCNLNTKDNYRDTIRVCRQDECQHVGETPKITEIPLRLPPSNVWVTSEWSKCDENCVKTRTVKCRNPRGNGCPIDRKPLNKRKCCAIKYVNNWSQCSVHCGTGVRRKELHCARVYKPEIKGTPRHRKFIDSSYCRHLRIPKPKRTQKPCKVSCKWSVSHWTQCSADCSNDYQSRSVYCESVFGNPINYSYCDDAKKPVERKICNNCIKREYKVVASCNCQGYRKRRLYCYDPQGSRIPCPTKEKIMREKCTPPRHCYPTSCYDIRRFQRTYEDREYIIYVRSMPKKIYCHDMSTSPKEFVTVNATENYSIYYDNKTLNPDECPPRSRRSEYRDGTLRSGRTNFYKIRIDLTTLRVYDNDFTFADSRGMPQTYGSAGDCYNRHKSCPQGDFSINLEQTGFHLKHGTVWEPYGHHVVIKESNSNSHMSHRALCGGWCGGCRIASNSALYLDV